jgi:hypothetical protein
VGKFFINYRREDAGAEAARIGDRLATVVGPGNVFVDFDDLKPHALAPCNQVRQVYHGEELISWQGRINCRPFRVTWS